MGFGISTAMTDNENPILVVDPASGTVAVELGDGEDVTQTWRFDLFCELAAPSWEGLAVA